MQDEQVTFNVFVAMKYPSSVNSCFQIDTLDKLVADTFKEENPNLPLEACLTKSEFIKARHALIRECAYYLEALPPFLQVKKPKFEELGTNCSRLKPSIQEPPKLDLKPLPSHLRYTHLGEGSSLPEIISASLNELEEEKLLRVLRDHKAALGWTIADIKGISPFICMHKILMEESFKPTIQPQHRLNPTLQEVVWAEVLKLLDVGIIYPISDSSWVSLV